MDKQQAWYQGWPVEKSFPGHEGRPGKVGGSLPRAMGIRPHPSNDKYFIVDNPSDEAKARVQELIKGKWAKLSGDKAIVHRNFISDFKKMIKKATRATTKAPTVSSLDEMEKWIGKNINSGKVAEYLRSMTPKQFNKAFAGKSVDEVEDYGKAMTS